MSLIHVGPLPTVMVLSLATGASLAGVARRSPERTRGVRGFAVAKKAGRWEPVRESYQPSAVSSQERGNEEVRSEAAERPRAQVGTGAKHD